MKKIFFKFFLLFSTLLSLGFAAESKNQELRIGTILPLTGDYQEIGNSVLKTFELTLFELPNVNVILIPFDNQSSTSGTKFAFQELQFLKGKLCPTCTALVIKWNKNYINIWKFE